jgi:hypothetical protein
MLALQEGEIRRESGIYALSLLESVAGAPPESGWAQTINGLQVLVTMDYGAGLALLGRGPGLGNRF